MTDTNSQNSYKKDKEEANCSVHTNTRKGSVQKVLIRPRQEVRILSGTYPVTVEKRVKVAIKRETKKELKHLIERCEFKKHV